MDEFKKKLKDLKREIDFEEVSLKDSNSLKGTYVEVGRQKGMVFEVRTKEKGHKEPHFHVRYSDLSGSYAINGLRALASNFPSHIEKKIIKWAQDNIDFIKNNWEQIHGSYTIY